MVQTRMEVQETIRRLRDKAVHPSTPVNEAETCSRLASKLETRHNFSHPRESGAAAPPAPKRETAPTPPGWSEAQVSLARSYAIGKAYKTFGTQFDVAAWDTAYGRAVAAQKAARVRFDAALAFEHGLEQYQKAKTVAAAPAGPTVEQDLRAMSDLELASEVVVLAHSVLEHQARLSYVKENGARGSVFGKSNAAKQTEQAQGSISREFHACTRRMRLVEAEIEHRKKGGPSVAQPGSYQFYPNVV